MRRNWLFYWSNRTEADLPFALPFNAYARGGLPGFDKRAARENKVHYTVWKLRRANPTTISMLDEVRKQRQRHVQSARGWDNLFMRICGVNCVDHISLSLILKLQSSGQRRRMKDRKGNRRLEKQGAENYTSVQIQIYWQGRGFWKNCL
jgi:hypothetical protein